MKERFEVNNGVIFDNNTGLMWMQEPLERLFTWEEACAIKHSFGGFDDCRLPTIEELTGIIDYKNSNPACHEVFRFGEEQIFWSSSPYVGGDSFAWYVNFSSGYYYTDAQHHLRWLPHSYNHNYFGMKTREIEEYFLGDIINGDTEKFGSLEEAKKALKSAEEDYEKRIEEEEEEINTLIEQGYEVKNTIPASEFLYIKRVTTIFDEDGDLEDELEEILI